MRGHTVERCSKRGQDRQGRPQSISSGNSEPWSLSEED